MTMNRKNEVYLEKPLPSSDESERVILGSVLIDNRLMQDAAESLTPGDFYSPLNRRVFAAMLTLHAAQSEINPILIGEELKREGPIESIGGVATITNLSFGLPYLANIDQYVKVVRDKANIRELIRTCTAITGEALAEETRAADIIASAQARINELGEAANEGVGRVKHFEPLAEVMIRDVMPALDELLHGRAPKIKTGFPAIDSVIGGLSPSDVMLLLADTGRGKSSLALQMAYKIAQQGHPVAFLAGEMTSAENVMRLLSQLSGLTNINSRQYLTEVEHQGLREWTAAIAATPMYFEHRITDMQTLGTHLRSIVRRHKIEVLVIDYIQLFKMERMDRRKIVERVADVSQEVKRLALELDIAVIQPAQVNRESAKGGSIGLHDAKSSGQLEHDASLVIALETSEDEYQSNNGQWFYDASLRVLKGRNVGRGEIKGRFYGRSVRFEFD